MRPGLFVLLFSALFLADGGTAPRWQVELPPVTVVASADDQLTVNVLELVCQTCAAHILNGCREIPGVASVDVDRKGRLITLHFDSSLTTRERVLAAVDAVVSTIP